MSLSAMSDELAQVRTKKKFLTQMDRIIPWGEWIALIRPMLLQRRTRQQALRSGTDAPNLHDPKSVQSF